MATCSRCGQEIEFRYIDGRPVPLHLYGGCGDYEPVRDYSGFSSSTDSCCFLTNCPECRDEVYFIRHNGGSVWIDPPLGPPWYKHGCMHDEVRSRPRSETGLVSERELPSLGEQRCLLLGIVNEAEVSISKKSTMLGLVAGKSDRYVILCKNNAGYLLEKIVIIDLCRSIIYPLNEKEYKFQIPAVLHIPKGKRFKSDKNADCPECGQRKRRSTLYRHMEQIHGFRFIKMNN